MQRFLRHRHASCCIGSVSSVFATKCCCAGLDRARSRPRRDGRGNRGGAENRRSAARDRTVLDRRRLRARSPRIARTLGSARAQTEILMKFELRDSLSLPGDVGKPNEDAFVHAPRFAAVFDGATGLGERLMPGKSDAQWLAQFGARRLAAHAQTDEGGQRDWLRSAAAEAEKSFAALRKRAPAENYEMPFASLIALSLENGTLDATWFGDCAALIRSGNGAFTMLGETLGKRARERERA